MKKKIDTGILGAKIGELIYDRKTGNLGKLVDIDDSTMSNWSIYCVDFGGEKPRRIDAMDDAQRTGRYEIVKKTCEL